VRKTSERKTGIIKGWGGQLKNCKNLYIDFGKFRAIELADFVRRGFRQSVGFGGLWRIRSDPPSPIGSAINSRTVRQILSVNQTKFRESAE